MTSTITLNGRVPTKLAFSSDGILSSPVYPPADRFEGAILNIGFVFRLTRMRSWAKRADEVIGDLLKESAPILAEEQAVIDTWNRDWADKPYDDEKQAAFDTYRAARKSLDARSGPIYHSILTRKFGYLVQRVEPGEYDLHIDPLNPASLDILDSEEDRALGKWPVLAFLVSGEMFDLVEASHGGPF